MPTYPAPPNWANPVYWNVWGHSYFNNAFGPRATYGRIDGYFRSLIPIGYGDFANYAVAGARLSVEGQSQGGYARILNNVTQLAGSTGPSGPPVAQMGAHIFCYGINDLGYNGDTGQYNTAFAHAMRTVISRARMSWLRPNNWAGAAGTGVLSYTSMTNTATTAEYTSGYTGRFSTAGATGGVVTFTLPSDYRGETIASLWIANPGVAGGTITLGGTALSGTSYSGATFSTSNIMPSASLNHSPVCHRIKGLTSAAAGLTITYTITAVDSGATIAFDSIWGEAASPGPIIWCNTPRLTAAGYALYPTGIGDADVAAFNAVQPPVIAEFDAMVQMADIDSAINKDPTALVYDGLHPNELGGALCARAFQDALNSINQPTSQYGLLANLEAPGPRYAQLSVIHRSGQWYTAPSGNTTAGTAYTPVANDLWAVPFFITAASLRITRWLMSLAAAGSAAGSVWFGLYDDRAYSGYPQQKWCDTTSSTAMSLTTTAGAQLSPTSTGNGYISQPMDPGLWWLVLQVATIGTSQTWTTQQGPNPHMPSATAAGQLVCAGYKLTGQPSGPLPKTFPVGAAPFSGAVPLMAFQMT